MAYKIRNSKKRDINIPKATTKIMEHFRINGVPVSKIDREIIMKILKEEKYGKNDQEKKSFYFSLPPEKREKAYYFLNANYSNDDLDTMPEAEVDKFLKQNRKEWDY